MFLKASHVSANVVRGRFLILFSGDRLERLAYAAPDGKAGPYELRGLVRYVTMRQVGHFMMGHAQVVVRYGKVINVPLSGTYGQDGLPKDGSLFPELFEFAVPLPDTLMLEFWYGANPGHNSAGGEGPAVREWANANYTTLSKKVSRYYGSGSSTAKR